MRIDNETDRSDKIFNDLLCSIAMNGRIGLLATKLSAQPVANLLEGQAACRRMAIYTGTMTSVPDLQTVTTLLVEERESRAKIVNAR